MQNLFPGSFRKDTENKFQIKLGPAITVSYTHLTLPTKLEV